jgi:hypothetical protein
LRADPREYPSLIPETLVEYLSGCNKPCLRGCAYREAILCVFMTPETFWISEQGDPLSPEGLERWASPSVYPKCLGGHEYTHTFNRMATHDAPHGKFTFYFTQRSFTCDLSHDVGTFNSLTLA